MGKASCTPELDAFRFYYDGTESGSTPIDSENTNVSVSAVRTSDIFHIRILIQETGGADGGPGEDWQWQYSRNGGGYVDLTTSSTYLVGADSSYLTDGAATTNRSTNGITDGTGSFIAGVVEETGFINNFLLSANNFTEHLLSFSITESVSASDYFEFRLLYSGATFAYNVTPRFTVTSIPVKYVKTHTADTVISPVTHTSHHADAGMFATHGYTYGDESSLPTDTSNADTFFESTDYTTVATSNNSRVSNMVIDAYAVFVFKEENDNNTDEITGTWEGQSSLAPTSSTVYLQIYNHNTPGWETLDSDNSTAANTDFQLSGSKTSSLSYYYDSNNWVTFRVYQDATTP